MDAHRNGKKLQELGAYQAQRSLASRRIATSSLPVTDEKPVTPDSVAVETRLASLCVTANECYHLM